MNFKLTNSNRFLLPGNSRRLLHLATIHHGLREYICFVDTLTIKVYIEEVTGGGGPYFIEDDALAEALHKFLEEKGVLSMSKPLLPDSLWYNKNKKR